VLIVWQFDSVVSDSLSVLIVWQFDSVVSDVSVWHGESVCKCVCVCGDVGLTGMDCSPDLPV